MQHLANRYFNRGLFLLTVKDSHETPKECERLGLRDLEIARDMDLEVISYGEEIGWSSSDRPAKLFDVMLVRLRGFNMLLSLGYQEVWEVEEQFDEAKLEDDNDTAPCGEKERFNYFSDDIDSGLVFSNIITLGLISVEGPSFELDFYSEPQLNNKFSTIIQTQIVCVLSKEENGNYEVKRDDGQKGWINGSLVEPILSPSFTYDSGAPSNFNLRASSTINSDVLITICRNNLSTEEIQDCIETPNREVENYIGILGVESSGKGDVWFNVLLRDSGLVGWFKASILYNEAEIEEFIPIFENFMSSN